LVDYWRKRWLINRRNRTEVRDAVTSFDRSKFIIK
jgi:hypothetical protein